MNFIKPFLILLIALSLLSCGGDDDDNDSDTTPDDFEFTDQIDAGLETYVESGNILIEGLNEETSISITGGEYSVDGGAFTDEAGTINNDQYVEVRVLSADTLYTTTSTTLTIGGISDTFSVRTVELALTVRADFKSLIFSWPKVNGATHYRLLQRGSADDEFEVYGRDYDANTTGANIPVPVHRLDWWDMEFQLEACIDSLCSSTDSTGIVNQRTNAIAYLKAPNTNAHDRYSVVAISGDGSTIAVGAPGEDSAAKTNGDIGNNGLDGAGAVYIYKKTNEVWDLQTYLKAPTAGENDGFGTAISLSNDGNTIVVGAPGEDSQADGIDMDQFDNSAENAGAAYVYRRSGDTWLLQNYIKASNSGEGDLFGSSVSLSTFGSTLSVGAPGEGSNSLNVNGDEINDLAPSAGAVYVYALDGDNWTQQAYIKASNTDAGDLFGSKVSINKNGSTLVVGAPHESSAATSVNGIQTDNNALLAGAAYVYSNSGGAWEIEAYLKPVNNAENYLFGSALDISALGDVIAIGAPGEASNDFGVNGNPFDTSYPNAGAAYTFVKSGSGEWEQATYFKASDGDSDDLFGTSLALNADATLLVVGAPGEASANVSIDGNDSDDTAINSGAAYVFENIEGEWQHVKYVKASNTNENDMFGKYLDLDVSGNSLIVGAEGEQSNTIGLDAIQSNNSLVNAGAAYLY